MSDDHSAIHGFLQFVEEPSSLYVRRPFQRWQEGFADDIHIDFLKMNLPLTVPPWSQDAQATPVKVASTGIIVDGADEYSYGVYVFANSTRADSTAQMAAILDSIVVSAP